MNTPKLRFKEFNNLWQNEKLEDAVEFLDEKRKPIKDSDRNNIKGEYPYYGASGIIDYINDYIFDEDLLLLGEDGANILSRSTKLVFKATGKYWVNNHAHVLKPKENYNIDFLESYLENINYESYNTGTAQPKLNQEVCKKINIKIPSLKEQIKIGKTLSLLDKKIELQSKKIEDLKLFKKGLHDKLFNDVTGNDYLLSDIAVFENGKGHENIVDENGKYILINSKFISTEGNVTKKCSEQLTPLFKNDITMVMSDLPNGKALAKCYYIDENNKYSLNQRICKIKVKDDSIINSKYLFYLLNRNSYYLRFDDGVNQTNLKKDDILSLNLVLPSIKDQERDSKTLTIIDNIIEKENNKLSKLNLLKKGLMQSMFV